MAFIWLRENRANIPDREQVWYLLDEQTELTHIRVVWAGEKDWQFVICNPPTVGRTVHPVIYKSSAYARSAATSWWVANFRKHLKQFED